MTASGTILYCPVCGSASFTLKVTREGVIKWFMCLECGMSSDVTKGAIEKWRGNE